MSTFQVSLNPAERDGDFITTKYFLGQPTPSKTFEAKNTDEVLEVVREFATAHGAGCQAYVRMIQGARKPAGFKDRTSRLFFNLD